MGIDLVLNGHIGEVQELYVWAPGGVSGGGDPTPQPVPEDLDYEMWLGPAPKEPYSPDRVSNKGAWYTYDYALGFIAGWGAHPLDQLQWYVAPTMPFFSPAVLYDAPYSMAAGETLFLRYRVVVSSEAISVDKAEETFREWTTPAPHR
jgi:hypothetical protein